MPKVRASCSRSQSMLRHRSRVYAVVVLRRQLLAGRAEEADIAVKYKWWEGALEQSSAQAYDNFMTGTGLKHYSGSGVAAAAQIAAEGEPHPRPSDGADTEASRMIPTGGARTPAFATVRSLTVRMSDLPLGPSPAALRFCWC